MAELGDEKQTPVPEGTLINAKKNPLLFPAHNMFANERKHDSIVDQRIDHLTGILVSKGTEANPFTTECFRNPILFNALPKEIRDNDQLLLEYIENTGKLNDLIGHERQKRFKGGKPSLFGEEVHLQGTVHADGRKRSTEDGYRINIDYLRSVGIDPTRVLFFRITQPMREQPKPEYYWTSDFFEVIEGLNHEVIPSKRKTAIILVADMQTINENGGLIQDINDDNGIAVRQIGEGPFNQHRALTQFAATGHHD